MLVDLRMIHSFCCCCCFCSEIRRVLEKETFGKLQRFFKMDNHSQPQVLRYNTIPKDVRLLQLVCDRAGVGENGEESS